jgi:predicted alpha/beta superfamily hydrolase
MKKNEQLRIELTDFSNEKGAIFLTGNFNGWKPADIRYQMQEIEENSYYIDLPFDLIPEGKLDYKYTRGDWNSVELNQSGKHTPNRQWEPGWKSPNDTVTNWLKDEDVKYTDYYPIIEDVSNKFKVPDPIKTRRISVLLPWNYHRTNKRYPVVFLQDGQNLFQDKSPYGNWRIDRKMARLSVKNNKDIIVLAVDHTHEDRIAEYTPPHIPDRAETIGKAYIAFLMHEIVPFVHCHYRTIGDAENTIIGGSSMGGLISLYAHIAYPHVFGKGIIFSPSLWLIPDIFEWCRQHSTHPEPTMTYLYCGGKESKDMVQQLVTLYHGLQVLDTNKEIVLKVNARGEHHESFWGEEFVHSINFLV